MPSADLVEKFKSNGKTDVIFDFDGTICSLSISWQNWHRGKGSPGHHLQNRFFEKYGKKLRGEMARFNSDYEKENIVGGGGKEY